MPKKYKQPSRKTSSTNGKAAVDCAQAVVEPGAVVADESASASAPKLDYKEAVREGKEIIAAMEAGNDRQMRLGELADGVEKQYRKNALKRYAKDIGVALCTLERMRSVYRAWKEAPGPISYSVARELQAHPDRFDIVRQHPNLTKREARKIVKFSNPDPPRDRTVAGIRRWWTSYLKRHIELIKEGRSLDGVASDIIRQAIEPTSLSTPIRSITASQKIVDRVRDAHDETPEDEAVERGPLDETPTDATPDLLDETPTDEASLLDETPTDEASLLDETSADEASLLDETPAEPA